MFKDLAEDDGNDGLVEAVQALTSKIKISTPPSQMARKAFHLSKQLIAALVEHINKGGFRSQSWIPRQTKVGEQVGPWSTVAARSMQWTPRDSSLRSRPVHRQKVIRAARLPMALPSPMVASSMCMSEPSKARIT